MWTFTSERRFAATAWAATAATAAAAAAFFWIQNAARPVGGEISVPKAAWLGYAILFWLVLPALIATDPRVDARWRRPYAALAVLMLARGAVELWMLYVSHTWSPWYGIAHDLLCVAVLAGLGAGLHATSPRKRCLRTHLAVTAAMFGPEIYFAWYMQAHFTTTSDAAVYFVPDDPAHALVLNVTIAAVVFLTAYLPFFLRRWLHAPADRDAPTLR